MNVTGPEICGGLRGVGLADGDRVIVHSSLSSIGWVDGGAEVVVDALLNVVGENGTVMMPTFTEYADGYHPDETPSTTGQITEEFRCRETAVRSSHPTKSVAVIGPDADELTESHPLMESLGVGSPMHRMVERGASILLLGVDHTSNSMIHVGEKVTGVPYRDQVVQTKQINTNGREQTVEVNQVHCSRGFGKLECLARRAGLIRDGCIGEAETQLVGGDELLALIIKVLGEHPGFLLCNIPDCDRCQYARCRLAEVD